MSTRRVLIVEDELVVQLHLRRIVSSLGHDVIGSAANEREALEMARENPPDLVLTDIRLADGSDGIDTARALVREHGCAVVFVSAYADDATVQRSSDIGAAGYLVKPFSTPQVRAAIATALASREKLRWERLSSAHLDAPQDALTEKRRFGEGTRLLVYSHDTFGLGHMRRCMALIRTLSERFPGISMLLVTGSPMVHRYTMPTGADYVKLPSLHKVGAEQYEARSLRIPGADVVALRSNLILNAVRAYQPNVLLVDHSPTGGSGELGSALEWLRERGGCRCILGLRDIVDSPETVRKTWQERGVLDALERYYDHVAVYGSQEIFDPISAYGLSPAVAAKATFVEYVCASAVDGVADGDDTEDPDSTGPFVFVTIGGGDGGGETVVVPFLEMMRRFADRIDFGAEIVTGPFVDPWLNSRFAELAEGLPVRISEFVPSTRRLMERAAVVVSTAGYNTVTDVLSWARSSILIPRALYRQEQALRAERLSELGLCRSIHPQDVTPERLFELIQQSRSDRALSRARDAGLPLDGASRFADFCSTLEVDVQPSLLDCPSGIAPGAVSRSALPARPWHDVGDLTRLLDAESRLQMLVDSGVPAVAAEPTYLRLKPGEGALLGLALRIETPDGEISLPGYVRTHDQERAEELMRKWHTDRSVPTAVGDGVRLLAGGRSVLFLFPNDARIRGMRFVADIDKLKRLLAGIEAISAGGWRVRGRKTVVDTVRYKPERRLILRAHLEQRNDATGEKRSRDVFIRFFTDDRGERIAGFRRGLEGQPISRHLPRLLGVAEGGRLFVEEAVSGEELIPLVVRGEVSGDAIAALLSELHAAEIADLPALSAAEVLETARESAANLARVENEFEDLLTPILDKLRASPPRGLRAVTLHGDCHLHQFLYGEDGPVLVDFERMARGHPFYDLGHLCAHLLILEKREPDAAEAIRGFRSAVVNGYLTRNPDLRAEDLAFFVGCGILERALLPFRRLEQGWRDRCRERLQLACEALSVTPSRPRAVSLTEPWIVVHPRSGDSWPGWTVEDKKKRFGIYVRRLGLFVPVDPTEDHELPGIAPWAERGELLNYRSGRRAIFRLDRNRFAKVVRPRKVRKIAKRIRRLQQIADRANLPDIPRLLEVDEENGAFVISLVPGESLHSRLKRGTDDFDNIATGLVRFHGVELSEHDGIPPVHEHASLATWAGFVAEIDRELHALCEQAIGRIESFGTELAGPANRLVHGDLHDKNLLVRGDALGIVDLDQAGMGNPAIDLGNLGAHFVLRAMQADRPAESGRAIARRFFRSYVACGGELDQHSVMSVGARTLFRLACLYRFRKRWLRICPALLSEVDHWVGGEL